MSDQPKICYFFDPLCGWCYGFSKVVHTVFEQYQDQAQFRMVLGGMIVGEREGPIGDFAEYILDALPRLQSMTGATIGEPFKQALKERRLFQSSVIPSKAIIAVRKMEPAISFSFARAVQQKQFIDGEDLQQMDTYRHLAEDFNLDADELLSTLHSDAVKQEFQSDIAFTQSMAVQGFPTMIGKPPHSDQYQLLSNGYTNEAVLEARISHVLKPQS
jgi:putative protein-disulfide isomerase